MPPDYFEEEEFETRFTGKTLRRILGLLAAHKGTVAAFLVMIAFVSGFDALFTYISKLAIDQGILKSDLPFLYRMLTYYGGLTIAQALFVFGFIYTVGILGERIRYELRQKMFNHLQNLSLSYYSRTPVGWIMARVTSDSDRVADLVTWGLLDITWAATNILTSLAFMLYINWRLALVVILMVPVMAYVATEFRKRILKEYRNVRKINSKITGQYNENITGVRVVKALVREEANAAEFAVLTGDMYKAAYRAAWLSALFLPSVQLISAMAVGFIAWYAGWSFEVAG
ncbi:ABC transporter transmembrane domain-containing protein, partial [Anaerolinea sp.]|uniref:ABC transporter transmembrane domain-containing protein n=1 Tax=Anaerolinea sp. TaxID=1872519 RepID=UPI002ACE9975